MRSQPRGSASVLAMFAVLVGSCTVATDVELLEISSQGAVAGLAFVDANGNGVLDSGDQPLREARIVLTATVGSGSVGEAQTDTVGVFRIPDVPLGSYLISIDPTVLGDSLEAIGTSNPVTVVVEDTAQVILGASFPILTLAQVRASAPGRRVFTSGIALNQRVPFGDGQVHLQAGTSYLRATNVERASLNTGDSVRFLGRTVLDNGNPALDEVTPFVLISRAQLVLPVDVSTGNAAQASGGPLDAALARVRTAEITDTGTVSGDFRFTVDDGSGPVDVILRSALGLTVSGVGPDSIVRLDQATGLLSPHDDGTGTIRWRLLPRGASDVTFQTKDADLSISARFDTAQAVTGDTVRLTVAVRNNGPLASSGFTVSDTIPSALAFVSSQATRGTYNPGTRAWTLDSLAAGRADTLTITATVTTMSNGTVTNVARVGGLLRERDPNTGNNVASASLGVGPRLADLLVSTSFDTTQASQGDTVEIRVLAVNAGPRSASGVVVADTLSSAFTLLSSSASRGSYSAATGLWTVGSLPVGVPADTLRLNVEIAAGTLGARTNTARFGALTSEVDPNNGNNASSASITIGPRLADLQVTASFDTAQASVGDTVRITVLAVNAGPRSASSVIVADTLSTSFTLLAASTSRGAYNAATGIWTLGTMQVGVPADTLRLDVEIATAALGTRTNTARFGALTSEVDPNTGNNVSQPTINLIAPPPP